MAEERFIETFREEALELLGALEENLLELEENPRDREQILTVFRAIHTIKGSAGMFGLERISRFAHQVESILTALREGRIAVSRALIDKTLEARDLILAMMENLSECTGPITEEEATFLETFRVQVGISTGNKEFDATAKIWRIHFAPEKDAFRFGANPLSIIKKLSGFGETVVVPDLRNLPCLADLNPEDCVTAWEIFLATTATEKEIRDVFLFMEDLAEIQICAIDGLIDEETLRNKSLGEILVEKDVFSETQKSIGTCLMPEVQKKTATFSVVLDDQQSKKARRMRVFGMDMSTIRVKSEKLDELMALVGELITTHARIQQLVRRSHANDDLVGVVEHFGRLADELHNNTMSIRMVPIAATFASFKRLVHDLSVELGKNVELVIEGGETELDKTVIEKLNDLLVHSIRNSLDHGIETPEERKAQGKRKIGTISLSASQKGAFVYVRIRDDGRGLDVSKIRSKAISLGIINSDDTLSNEDIYQLIFTPGFSTKEQATELSGRGVGMDVVKRQMELLNGTVTVESSPGAYTQITLKVPLTLAIIEGLLVRIANDFFVIPLSSVVGCTEYLPPKEKKEPGWILYHEEQIPVIVLRQFFSVDGERPLMEQLVVVLVKGQQTGLLVDQVVGSNQTVVKPLSKLFRQSPGVSSATILGDGSVALILDVEHIVTVTEKAAV